MPREAELRVWYARSVCKYTVKTLPRARSLQWFGMALTHTHLHYYGTHDNERIYNMLKKIIFNIIFTFQKFVAFFSLEAAAAFAWLFGWMEQTKGTKKKKHTKRKITRRTRILDARITQRTHIFFSISVNTYVRITSGGFFSIFFSCTSLIEKYRLEGPIRKRMICLKHLLRQQTEAFFWKDFGKLSKFTSSFCSFVLTDWNTFRSATDNFAAFFLGRTCFFLLFA